jgi:recombinational DNA repair protein RecR
MKLSKKRIKKKLIVKKTRVHHHIKTFKKQIPSKKGNPQVCQFCGDYCENSSVCDSCEEEFDGYRY